MSEWNETLACNVVEAFHAATVWPDLWPCALQKLSNLFGAEGCLLAGGPASSFTPICSPSLENFLAQAVRQGWPEKDIHIEKSLLAFQMGNDIVTESLICSAWELDHHRSAVEFFRRVGGWWYAEIVLAGEGPSSIILKLQRLGESGPFSELLIENLRRLRPALQQAGNFALRLAAAHHDGLLAAFGTFDYGVVLIDQKGRVLRVNTKAEVLMSGALTVQNGILRASASQSDAVLQKLIRSVLAQGSITAPHTWGALTIALPETSPLLVYSAPLFASAADRFRQARAALMVVAPNAYRTSLVSDLRQIFGLTSSEAAIAVELSLGRDIDETAAMRQVSSGTLRAQLKSIFLKTGTRRQSELVALVLRYSRLPIPGEPRPISCSQPRRRRAAS